MPTGGWISVVPDISASGFSSDCTLSVCMSSASTLVEFWWRIDGRLRDLPEGARIEVGRTVGDRSCGGGSGVVGEAGCDDMLG